MSAVRSEPLRWTVIVPLRALPNAKSRLAATVPAESFVALVEAIRADTLAAVRASSAVARLLVVGDAPAEGVDLVQVSPGLNGALRDAARHAREQWPGDGVAALVGDLPALRAEELTAALDTAAMHRAAFVPDADATGTTLLAAAAGVALDPRFGPGSAERHGAIAAAVDAGPGLRQDVDTAADLNRAVALGVGPATAAVLDPAGRPDTVVTRSS